MSGDFGRMRRAERRRETMKQSQAVLHQRQTAADKSRCMTGFDPGGWEKSSETAPHEILNLENAFGSIVLGVNRRQEYTFLVREKRRLNSPEPVRDQKIIDGDRKKVFSTHYGLYMTNSHDERRSAAAVRTRRGQPPDRLIESVSRFAAEKGQQAFREVLPFTELSGDRVELGLLEARAGELRGKRTKQSAAAAGQVQGRLEDLRHMMWKKDRMKRQIESKLKAAMKFPSLWPDDGPLFAVFPAPVFKGSPKENGEGEETGSGGEEKNRKKT